MAAAVCVLILVAARGADAGCNLIPGTELTFNSTLGATNRPFAAPGESLELRLRPCDAPPGLTATAADHVVTVVFPGGSEAHAVVLTADPDCAAVAPKLAACEAQLGGGPGRRRRGSSREATPKAYRALALNRLPSFRLVLEASNVLDQQRGASLRWICTITEGS